jgi:hypothetical protein
MPSLTGEGLIPQVFPDRRPKLRLSRTDQRRDQLANRNLPSAYFDGHFHLSSEQVRGPLVYRAAQLLFYLFP